MDLQAESRRYAVGISALVAEGQSDGATVAMRDYVRSAMLEQFTPYEAMVSLANSLIGLSVAAADHHPEGAVAFFRNTALVLADRP